MSDQPAVTNLAAALEASLRAARMERLERAPLTLLHFLETVEQHRTSAREVLIAQGFHPNVVYAKAEKSARRGYTEYGVIADRPWLTDKGIAYLRSQPPTAAETNP